MIVTGRVKAPSPPPPDYARYVESRLPKEFTERDFETWAGHFFYRMFDQRGQDEVLAWLRERFGPSRNNAWMLYATDYILIRHPDHALEFKMRWVG